MEDKDKGLDFTKPPPEPELTANRSVPRCFLMREAGFKHRTNSVPSELQWAAEDGMIMRNHEEFRCQLPDVSKSTFLVVFSPDGKKVASTHGNHNVYVTDLTSGKNIKTLTGHPRTPWCIAFHPSSNQILASGCLGGQVRVWDLSGGSEVWNAESQTVIASLAFHPVDRMLVIASYNELHFWDWSRPQPFARCFTANEKEKVRYVAFDALGHKLITGVANVPTRPPSQWDRVAAPQPPPPTSQLDSERRITICYRYMVEQYEQLVQRYCDLSRARNTLTMDRGTDPMEQDGEPPVSQRPQPFSRDPNQASRTARARRIKFPRHRVSSGTDEASASHSSTNFLTPPDTSPPVTESATTTANGTPTLPPFPTLPAFNLFPPMSSSAFTPNPSSATPSTSDSQCTRTRPLNIPLNRLSLSPGLRFTQAYPSANQSPQNETQQNDSTPTNRTGQPSSVARFLNLMSSWTNRSNNNNQSDGTSTEVPSGVDSENEDQESFQSVPSETQNEDESQAAAAAADGEDTVPLPDVPRTSSEGSVRQHSEASSVSQLRSQFHRLQTAYENRNSASSSQGHVFSPETLAAERRLLNRLHEFLDRPLPEPRPRRMFASHPRRSAFRTTSTTSQPTPTSTASTSTGTVTSSSPDIIGGVRYGIQLLSRRIENMQRLCRARLEILQLQEIRHMWEDLQSQIYALHGVVREGEGGETTPAPEPATPTTTTTTTAAAAADLLTDDDSDGPSNNGECIHWRVRRTPQTNRRSAASRLPSRNTPFKRSRLVIGSRTTDSNRRMSLLQNELSSRRQHIRQASSSTQATSEERGEASSSQVSEETSTGTSDERSSLRGVKRKSRDTDSLFRPRPSSSASAAGNSQDPGPSTSTGTSTATSTSSLVAVMRQTIVQLENMVWRHRQSAAQRNSRLSRFTRQREERQMRNLWDTESSHESSRDDQSEGDSSQQSSPGDLDNGDPEWFRDPTRIRARQVLLLMVDSLTQFFENDSLSRRSSNEALNERIHNLYILLQLALNLTDLLLAQLVHCRRELEARRPSMLEGGSFASRHYLRSTRLPSRQHMVNRNIGRTSLTWRRILRRSVPPPTTSPSPSPPPQPPLPRRSASSASSSATVSPTSPSPSRTIPGMPLHRLATNIRSVLLSHNPARPVVPIVRVNDLPAPPPEATPTPRFRPHSPPPMGVHPMFVPPRFLHPARYASGGSFVFDESTSEDSSPQDRGSDFIFMRGNAGGYGSNSVILTDTSLSPHHRIQAWDFSKYVLPDLGQAEKNLVVGECKIHNDASVDMSKDGRLLVTLLPSGRLNITTLLGIYSLQWDTLGQLLYTTSFEQSIVSVSLSPTTRHLVVGLATRRVAMVSTDRLTNAQVFRLEGASPGRKGPIGARGRLNHLRDLELSRPNCIMSLNCIRWAPNPGQGLVYGTNTGLLKILR